MEASGPGVGVDPDRPGHGGLGNAARVFWTSLMLAAGLALGWMENHPGVRFRGLLEFGCWLALMEVFLFRLALFSWGSSHRQALSRLKAPVRGA